MDKNQGYSILKAVMLENGRGFALGEPYIVKIKASFISFYLHNIT